VDLNDTLDYIAETAAAVVVDSRRWRPERDNAAVSVSVEPVVFDRGPFGGNRFHLEVELVLRVASGDVQSQQVDAAPIALALWQHFDSTLPDGGGIDSWAAGQCRFIRPSPGAEAGTVLTLEAEVMWT
jgi:hypothetical protein